MSLKGELHRLFDVVKWPVVASLVLTLAFSLVGRTYVEHEEFMGGAIGVIWLIVPPYIGWSLAQEGEIRLFEAVKAGALFGFMAEVLYYMIVLIGWQMGYVSFGFQFLFVDQTTMAIEILKASALGAAISMVRSAALAGVGLLASIFVIKMKEAG